METSWGCAAPPWQNTWASASRNRDLSPSTRGLLLCGGRSQADLSHTCVVGCERAFRHIEDFQICLVVRRQYSMGHWGRGLD